MERVLGVHVEILPDDLREVIGSMEDLFCRFLTIDSCTGSLLLRW